MKGKNKNIWKGITIIMLVLSILSFAISFLPVSPAIDLPASCSTASLDNVVSTLDYSRKMDLTYFEDEDIDQSQETLTNYFYIGYVPPTVGCYGQDFRNDQTGMYGFSVPICRIGTPTEPLCIGVLPGSMYMNQRSPLIHENYYDYTIIQPTDIPVETYYWLGVDMTDNPEEDNLLFNIVCMSLDDPTDGNHWGWGAGDSDPLPGYLGSYWHWTDEEWFPRLYPVGYDFCFRSYTGESDDPDPDGPEILISTSSWVSQASGLSFLVFAIISGIKFRWF